jgi:predicted homoserine dehydrogenase-like protein
LIENAEIASVDELLPVGLSEGCRVLRNIRRDEAISYNDVELPSGRLGDRLRVEQDQHFHTKTSNPANIARREKEASISATSQPEESIH